MIPSNLSHSVILYVKVTLVAVSLTLMKAEVALGRGGHGQRSTSPSAAQSRQDHPVHLLELVGKYSCILAADSSANGLCGYTKVMCYKQQLKLCCQSVKINLNFLIWPDMLLI